MDTPAQPHTAQHRGMTRAMRILLGSYLALIVAIMVIAQISITPDLFVLWTLVVAVMLGRGLAFLRDWLPLVAIFVAWESARGLSQHLATRVQSDSVIAAERFLFLGIVPTEELQRLWHDPARLTLLALLMSAVYLSHFLLPLAVGFFLWLRSRPAFFRYMTTLMLVSFAAFFTAIALPVAPPRFSAQYGEALAVRDVMADTFRLLGSEPSSWLYGNINGNPVAAFPSLHAAYPVVAWLFVRKRPLLGWAVGAYTIVVWFSITFLGHHYVVDIIGGVAYAVVAYAVVAYARWPTWFRGLGHSLRLSPDKR
jgi:membrane-associated phospholipid phosphatase